MIPVTEKNYEQYKNLLDFYMSEVERIDKVKDQIELELSKIAEVIEEYEKIHYPIGEPKYTEKQIRLALYKFGTGWVQSSTWEKFMVMLDDIVINDESY